MQTHRMKFKDHFSNIAADYARHRPKYPEELFRYLASLVSKHDLAWDCATGSGQAAHGLVHFFQRIIATDASIQQISHAVPHEHITYIVAPAEKSPLQVSSADLTTVATAIHWFDFDKFYEEVNRVLRPGGVVAAWCYGHTNISQEIDAVSDVYRKDMVESYWPPERHFVEEEYRTIPFPFDEIVAPSFTLKQEWTMDDLIGYWETWSSSKMYVEKNRSNPVDKVRKELEKAWGDPAMKRDVRWPLFMRVGRKKE